MTNNGLQSQKRDADKDLAKTKKPPTAEEMDTLKLKKAWEVALAPVKSLPMTFIMMYMSGNSLQIFSIMMVFMAFKNPIVGLAATNQAFERFETDSNRAKMVQVKLAYVAMQLVALAVGVWKVNTMGLLPCVYCRRDGGWMGRIADLKSQDDTIRLAGLGGAEGTARVCCGSAVRLGNDCMIGAQ